MEIKSYLKDKVVVFELDGKLDVNTASKVQEEVMTSVGQECRLVLDMKKCDYVSSAGLRVLLVISKQLAKVGGCGVIANLLEEVKDVMQMTGFDNLFKSYENVDQAVLAVMKGDLA
ncbi:MAG: putative anti-sigma factor antagonist BtrV [Firmicutes bacterium ADurb.Bin419]|nr:MAG: putative anti-sigma factor antagonist BtrV [Firmicutes bacterium ADurb.Bin419]